MLALTQRHFTQANVNATGNDSNKKNYMCDSLDGGRAAVSIIKINEFMFVPRSSNGK